MRSNCIYNLVHNRKNDNIGLGKSLVQLEVIFPGGKRMYISTGYYFTEKQWDNGNRCVINDPQARKLNKHLQDFIGSIRTHEFNSYEKGIPFTPLRLKSLIRSNTETPLFTEWAESVINKRMDLVKYSKYTHLRAIHYLAELFPGFSFNDLTAINISVFDDHLRAKGLTQTSIHKLHQVIKTYINRAVREDLMPYAANPYLKFKVKRGQHDIRKRWDSSEIEKVRSYKPSSEEIRLTHAITVFILNTGLSYKDLCQLTYANNYRQNNDGVSIEGLRKKTGEYYAVPLTNEAREILSRYPGAKLLPTPDRKKFNANLKSLCFLMEVSVLTSHELRHSSATWMLECGVDIRTVQLILGHSQLRTTEIYGKLHQSHLRQQIQKLR